MATAICVIGMSLSQMCTSKAIKSGFGEPCGRADSGSVRQECRSEHGNENGAPVGAPRRAVPARRLSIGPNLITDKIPTYIQYSYRHLPVPWGSRPAYINHSSKKPCSLSHSAARTNAEVSRPSYLLDKTIYSHTVDNHHLQVIYLVIVLHA
jgi:hypothetical protein